jgi:hypothetical protein
MKNFNPTLEDTMRLLYVLYNEGYILRSKMENILEKKFNVSSIEYGDDKFTCHQGNIKTSLWI